MAGERDVRAGRADAGIQIVDVGGARFAESDAVHLKPGGLEQRLQHAECAGVRGRHRRAADQVASDGESIGGHK